MSEEQGKVTSPKLPHYLQPVSSMGPRKGSYWIHTEQARVELASHQPKPVTTISQVVSKHVGAQFWWARFGLGSRASEGFEASWSSMASQGLRPLCGRSALVVQGLAASGWPRAS